MLKVGDGAACEFALNGRVAAARRSGAGPHDQDHSTERGVMLPDGPWSRSPLIDCFRRGEVARDIRLQAAQGVVALPALERVALLVLLTDDQDPRSWPQPTLPLRACPSPR